MHRNKVPSLFHKERFTIAKLPLRIGALQQLSPKDEKPGTAVRSDLSPQRLGFAAISDEQFFKFIQGGYL